MVFTPRDPAAAGAEQLHGAVLGDVRAQRPLDVPAVGLRDEGDDRGLGVEQGAAGPDNNGGGLRPVGAAAPGPWRTETD